MNIIAVAYNYPAKENQVHIFLRNILHEFLHKGHFCIVIAPQSVIAYFFKPKKSRRLNATYRSEKGEAYPVYSPLYFVLPPWKLFGLRLADITKRSFIRAVHRTYKKHGLQADIIYSHFLNAGIAGVSLAKKYNIPSFIANGEADTPASVAAVSSYFVTATLQNVTGIISVSTKNKYELLEMHHSGKDELEKKIIVVPNAVNTDKFHKKSRAECRRALCLPNDMFIISFTGSFIERKGISLLARVLNSLNDVYSIFIGTGPKPPQCKNILFCGPLKNEEISLYLNASNAFVLPSLSEGCSNAIVEAMACGLPIISSNLPFNEDILNPACALRVDPTSEEQLRQAIIALKNNPALCEALGAGSAIIAQQLTLSARAKKILSFLQEKVERP